MFFSYQELLELCEDLMWNRDSEATEKMLTLAKSLGKDAKVAGENEEEWRKSTVEERLQYALVKVSYIRMMRFLTVKKFTYVCKSLFFYAWISHM